MKSYPHCKCIIHVKVYSSKIKYYKYRWMKNCRGLCLEYNYFDLIWPIIGDSINSKSVKSPIINFAKYCSSPVHVFSAIYCTCTCILTHISVSCS